MRLENEHVRVELDPNTGGFRSVYDKHRRHEYIAAPDRALLFRVMAPEPGMACGHVDAEACDVSVSGNTATIVCKQDGMDAVVTLELEGSAVLAHMRLTSRGPRTIEEIMFP